MSTAESMRGIAWDNIADWLEWWLGEPRLSGENQLIFDKYYDSYIKSFPRYVKKYYARQTEEALQLISAISKPRVLEIGCGCGTESLWFALHRASVLGVDLAIQRLQVARERCAILRKMHGQDIDAEFRLTSIFDLHEKNGFDLIWMEQAFHHIEPRHNLPGKLFELLKPGGYVVISEANGLNPLLQLQLIRRRGFRTIREFTDSNGLVHHYGDERITYASRIEKLFSKNHFQLRSIGYFRVLPNVRSVDKFAWIEGMIPRWFLPAYSHFNIVMQKPHERID